MPELQVDRDKDIPGWSWSNEALPVDIPSMDGNMALTFQLADQFLKKLFPPSLLCLLKPYFDSAENVLGMLEGTDITSWTNKVRLLSRAQPLIPANIDKSVLTNIYDALFRDVRIRGRYIKRDGDEVEYDLNPLGLIFRESVIYLVATIWEYEDPRHFALHRFNNCWMLDQKTTTPDRFDLDKYIASGSFEYCEVEGKIIKLKAQFTDKTGHHLIETPLSEDQEIILQGDDQLLIVASVKDSSQLRWWLLGFGHYVEVLEPDCLRVEFSKISGCMKQLYQ